MLTQVAMEGIKLAEMELRLEVSDTSLSRDNYNSLSSDICQPNCAVWQPKIHLVSQNVYSLFLKKIVHCMHNYIHAVFIKFYQLQNGTTLRRLFQIWQAFQSSPHVRPFLRYVRSKVSMA